MLVPPEMFDEADHWAERELQWLKADDRWALLRRLMEREREIQIERTEAMLRLEAVRRRVAPHTKKPAWNKGLNPATDLDRWIHDQRLRDATL